METSLRVHGRMPAERISADHGPALWVLAALLLIAVAGCETRRAEQKSAGGARGGDSVATTGADAKPGARGDETSAAGEKASTAGRTLRVRLTENGCIQFEPTWATLGVGQSLTWHSELTTPVTLHVSAGAFDKRDYVLRAGQSVTSGPARSPGSYAIWTEPAACQGAPLGVRGSGPGVTVEGAARR